MATISPANQRNLVKYAREDNVHQFALLVTNLGSESRVTKAAIIAAARDQDNGKTLIHIAIEHGAREVLGYCLSILIRCPEVSGEALLHDGESLLNVAAAAGDLDVVVYLLDNCADYEDFDYELARDLARVNGHTGIVEVLDLRAAGW
ncbi:hypothetical protein SLS62_000055 [Diatrype stigma]|uniref:Uncharacterized protein n=1 Tax=Diatrype stigma TaxID=117547 RepID=A0AAN9V097_9PEZI